MLETNVENKFIKEGLTFDDVLLVPKKTSLTSRSLVDLSTYLTPKIKLSIPLVSPNMDTITESRMAVALATAGGIGIIHRFLSIEDEAEEVVISKEENTKVKEEKIEKATNFLKEVVNAIKVQKYKKANKYS